MEDEIDIRSYIEVVLRHWKWIVGLALVAAVAAFVLGSLQPSLYAASAIVIVTDEQYDMRFDPRFDTLAQRPAYQAFPTLAKSDGVLQTILDTCAPASETKKRAWNLATLAKRLKASSEGDPRLLMLTARSATAQTAADLVNCWAKVVVKRGNEIYGNSSDDVAFFEDQLIQAREALDTAEEAIVEFQSRDRTGILESQLASSRQAQADYLKAQRTIVYMIQDIRGLKEQWSQKPADTSASLADSLTTLLLQIQAFNAQSIMPIEIQVGTTSSLSEKPLAEQVQFLDEMVLVLQERSREIDQQLLDLEPNMLSLQEELQTSKRENARLTLAITLATETYTTLARKLDEVRIVTQEEQGAFQIGSSASVPQEPQSRGRVMNTMVAAALGLSIGVFGAFSAEFWRRTKPTDSDHQ